MFAGLPGRHAVPRAPHVRLRRARAAAVPAHHLQGRAAAGALARVPGRRGACRRLAARAGAAGARGAPLAAGRSRVRRCRSLFGLPLVTGRAIDERQAYGDVPAHWRAAIADAERDDPARPAHGRAAGRAVRLLPLGRHDGPGRPGALQAPAARSARSCPTPTGARASSRARSTTSSSRTASCPASSSRCCTLMGAGRCSCSRTASGARAARSTLPAPRGRSRGSGFRTRRPRSYGECGPTSRPGRGGAPCAAPGLRRYAIAGPPARARARAPAARGDRARRRRPRVRRAGGARALARRRARYAGDLDRSGLRGWSGRAQPVFTDSNRRRVVEADLLRSNQSPVLGPEDALPRDFPTQVLSPSLGHRRRR